MGRCIRRFGRPRKIVFYCQKLPKETFLVKIVGMERAEIEGIADYLEGLEEGFYEWDYRGMNVSYETKEQQLNVLLATLEYKARKCKQCIERRLTVRN